MNEKKWLNQWELLDIFINFCNENNVWYSADNQLLLYTTTNEKPETQEFELDVMMTLDSYEKLRTEMHNNILDNCKHSQYHSNVIKFVSNADDIDENQPFIRINLIIPTNVKNVKKLFKINNKLKNWASNLSSRKPINNLIWRLSFFNQTYKEIINILLEKENEGFLVVNGKIDKNIYKFWIPNLTFNTHIQELNNLKIQCINEYHSYLTNLFEKEEK
ncbi:Uncharacterised protein [Metamycoplasma cloacale]|uniref:Uncharacterized protein n=1 Tax=Metamycoplasma cloacale TaxID=92401 RepID=A0A2Z4LMK8_9BACT|nr:hypothetical protein [Metamycoplasma cloacale]AWX42976.1 hypothetical protein DK849_02805 [Metamycoplasma cloacale]VEU79200.1 Uncharacterised protein [Metamycoplasma cloacale]